MEEVSSKLKCKKVTMCTSFFMIVTTLLTLITFTSMINVGEVEAATVVSPNCGVIDQSPSGECSVSIDYDGNCSPSSSSCNIAVNINKNPGGGSINFVPSGDNELKLHSVLETGVECSDVKSSWGKANCLLNSKNNYVSNTIINTDGLAKLFDNEINYEGSQQVRDTSGQDNFKATNTMNQKADLATRGAGATIDTDGSGKNVILQYKQDIVHPDDTQNTNLGSQAVNMFAQDKSTIDTSAHEELGFNLVQTLRDNDDDDGTHISSPITTKNEANQVLNVDARGGATIKYDTLGLSTTTQDIYKCSFGQGSCTNTAGTTASPQSGMRTELTASGAGTVINVDDLQQLLSQKIQYFNPANNKIASNTQNAQVVSAVATEGGKINLATGATNTQSSTQSITNSKQNTGNLGSQTLNVGTNVIPVVGQVTADVDQTLQQSISSANTGPSSNTGTMTINLLSKTGTSQLFIEEFDQYLTQIATCSNCQNNGQVSATFEVQGDASNFILRDGSIQGLTQTATRDGVLNQNIVGATISVSGTGTNANIFLDQQISNTNMNNQGNSNFAASYSAGATQQCVISSPGPVTQATACSNG
jgi:hypothetical protein